MKKRLLALAAVLLLSATTFTVYAAEDQGDPGDNARMTETSENDTTASDADPGVPATTEYGNQEETPSADEESDDGIMLISDDEHPVMEADEVKEDTETVKTGEVDMLPIIISLAVVAAGAGAGYWIYSKNRK